MAQVNLRVDDATKAAAEAICEDMGLTMTAAINVFLKRLVKDRRIPFSVEAGDPFYSAANMARIRAAIADTRPPIVKTIEELEAMEDG